MKSTHNNDEKYRGSTLESVVSTKCCKIILSPAISRSTNKNNFPKRKYNIVMPEVYNSKNKKYKYSV
jgi:hypothetical protein